MMIKQKTKPAMKREGCPSRAAIPNEGTSPEGQEREESLLPSSEGIGNDGSFFNVNPFDYEKFVKNILQSTLSSQLSENDVRSIVNALSENSFINFQRMSFLFDCYSYIHCM